MRLTVSCAAIADGHERQVTGSPMVTYHHIKHPINHADMEVNMLVQAGAESVDESDPLVWCYLQRFQSINFVGLAHCGEYMDASAYKCMGVFKPNASSGISDKDRIHLFIKDGFST